jgi:hypothetical protein
MMMYNELTPTTTIESASQFHAVSWAEVQIDTNPKNGEIYKQGSKGYGENKIDYYALSNVALARLMNAAGIEETGSHRTDNREHPHVCAWSFGARYVQPDSTVLTYSADYELDLRDYINVNGTTFRGARFEKAMADEREDLIYSDNKKEWGNIWGDNLTKKVDVAYASMSEEQKKKYDDLSEAKALRNVVQMRQFIVQRAQTGAMERAIRKMLNLKSAYTLAELKNPFRVPRSRFDWDRLDAAIGKESGKELRQLEAMKLLGIDVSTYQQFKQLNAPAVYVTNIPADKMVGDTVIVGPTVDPHADKVEEDRVLPSVPETGENESSGPEDETPKTIESGKVEFQGQIVGLEETLGARVNQEPFKTWFKTNIFDKLSPRQHYDAHLKVHFGKSSAVNLSYRELIAMDNNLNKGIEYPEEYHPTEKKEKKPSTGTLSKRLEAANLTSLVAGMGLDTTDPKVIQVIEDMLLAVEKGVYDLKTDEGYNEAVTFLDMTLKA